MALSPILSTVHTYFLMLRVGLAFLGVLVTAIWLFGKRGGLGVGGEWMLIPNAQGWPLAGWGLPLGVLVIFGGASALSVYDRFKRAKNRKEQRNSTITALACLGIVLLIWPWSLLGPGQIQQGSARFTLEGRFNIIAALWSDVATEYFGAAYQIEDARTFTREYTTKWQRPQSFLLAHIATHPPGAVLWFYGARRVYETVPGLESSFSALASALTGQKPNELLEASRVARNTASASVGLPAPPALPPSALGGALFCAFSLGLSLVATLPAVYGLAATGGGEDAEKRGLLASAFWSLSPTLNLFAFTLDALVAAGVVWALFFAVRGIEREKPTPWLVASGVVLALTTFISIGALAVGVLLVLMLLLARRQALPAHAAMRALTVGGSAFIGTWVLLSLWGGFNPLEIVMSARAAHASATLEKRSYLPWVGMNLVTWTLFAGWPLVVSLFVRPKGGFTQGSGMGYCIGIAAILTILLLTLSGNVRGEVERLWLFLLAPLAVLAAWRLPLRQGVFLVGLQAAQTLVMSATLAPLVRPFQF